MRYFDSANDTIPLISVCDFTYGYWRIPILPELYKHCTTWRQRLQWSGGTHNELKDSSSSHKLKSIHTTRSRFRRVFRLAVWQCIRYNEKKDVIPVCLASVRFTINVRGQNEQRQATKILIAINIDGCNPACSQWEGVWFSDNTIWIYF